MPAKPTPEQCEHCYARAMRLLDEAGIPYLVAGSSALRFYTGLQRQSGDFDLFLCPEDRDPALSALADAGYETSVAFAHWIAKAQDGPCVLDLIYRSGNGVSTVRRDWFDHAPEAVVLGCRVRLCPPEEMLWIKAYIQERERFDGADVVHLMIRHAGLDWRRLLALFGPDWRLLLAHILLAGYSFPSERARIPAWLLDELLARLRAEMDTPAPEAKICRGTLLSRTQYLPDIRTGGYVDARLEERVQMSPEDIAAWTAAIDVWRVPH